MIMPVMFVGHGSPLNLTQDNAFTQGWRQMAQDIPPPKAILSISAHWLTPQPCLTTNSHLIYDFFGLPPAFYDFAYPAPGAEALSNHVHHLLGRQPRREDSRGLDHGTWMPACVMFPDADVPICQLSLQPGLCLNELLCIGQMLQPLREQGVLIMGSGNVVHNLELMDCSMPSGGYDWAYAFDDYVRDSIIQRDFTALESYPKAPGAGCAVPQRDHFDPLFYALGATTDQDRVNVYNNQCTLGSLSMSCYLWFERQ